MTQALVINASPNRGNGNTARLLGRFTAGLSAAGATVETINVYDLNVKPCLGCFTCWVKTPGECVQRDDMDTVLPKLAEADIVVFGTPVYVDGMSGPLKTLVDRLLPVVQAFVELREGRIRHIPRPGSRNPSFVLAATSGFPEPETFDPLIGHVKAMCKNLSWHYAGALTVPGGLRRDAVEKVGRAAAEAGKQVVELGEILGETEAEMRRHQIRVNRYVHRDNAAFRKRLQEVVEKQ